MVFCYCCSFTEQHFLAYNVYGLCYLMSLFFMRFREIIKKIGVTISIHARFRMMESWILPRAKDLVTVTALVSGRKICATTCRNSGMDVRGKNVPLKRNMGVMKR